MDEYSIKMSLAILLRSLKIQYFFKNNNLFVLILFNSSSTDSFFKNAIITVPQESYLSNLFVLRHQEQRLKCYSYEKDVLQPNVLQTEHNLMNI